MQITATLTIHEGKLAEFKDIAASCLQIVQEKDKGTQQYDWFFSEDKTKCVVREMYNDSDALLQHIAKKEKKIIAGGLPVGDRAIVFVVQASSNSEVDKLLRSLPAWGALKWKVTALESFAGRAAQERAILSELKQMSTK